MKFSAKTNYDLERLLRLNNFYYSKKKAFWIFLAAAFALILSAFVLNVALNLGDSTITFCFIFAIIMIAVLIFSCFVLPRFLLKKSPSLNEEILIEFYDDKFAIFSKMANGSGNSEFSYTAIRKIMESKQDFYLFISTRQAFVIDKAAVSLGTSDELKSFLISKGIKYKR
jgi:hypothetical protein